MKSIYLKPEEIEKAFNDEWRVDFREPLPSSEAMNAIAKASADNAVRVIIEWGDEHCPHAGPPNDDPTQERKYCNACWDELKKLTESK